MSRAAVDQLLYLMDEAFDSSDHEHSLMANLRSVAQDDWAWLPENAERSIAAIAGHVGACKLMYDDYAFGEGTLQWDDRRVSGRQKTTPDMTRVLRWIESAHETLRWHVSHLGDADLMRPAMTNWGEEKPLRWIISVMIQHDLYHAGEINRMRAIRQGNDRWAWLSE